MDIEKCCKLTVYSQENIKETTDERSKIQDLDTPTRVLLGPGPGMPHPRVIRALGSSTLGHLDPELLKI